MRQTMDFDEMKKAVERSGWNSRPVIFECVDYSSIYRYIYDNLKRDGLVHEDLHLSAIKITDALWSLHLLINDRDERLEDSADAVVATALKLFQ